MNVKLRVLSAGVLFFIGGQIVSAQKIKPKKDTINNIEEVVIVNLGYTKMKKENTTGDVASVKAEDIESTPGATVQQALTGKLAGVDISFGSGQPGSSNFRVDIRGTNTINGTSTPLYVLDGVPISSSAFQLLDPNSFEEVGVIKDIATAAQYGASGGAGVVLLTSKKGRARQRALVTYTGQFGVSTRSNDKVTLMNSNEWNTFRRRIGLNNPYTSQPYTDQDIDALSGRNTDWKKLVFQNGTFSQHDFAVTGGSDTFNYFTQLSYLSQDGIIRASDYERTSAVINLFARPSDKFTFQFNNTFAYGDRNNVSSEGAINLNNPVVATFLAPPSDEPFLPNGQYNTGAGNVGGNALQTINTRIGNRKELKIVSSVAGTYQIVKNLSARQFVGIDHTSYNTEGYTDPNTYLGSITTPGNSGALSRGNSQISSIINNTSLTYKNTFAEKHDLSATALYEYFYKTVRSFGYTGYGLNNLYYNSPSGILVSANTLPSVTGGKTNYHRVAFLGNVNYVYDGKYSFNGSIRRESASNFGTNFKWGTFYGIGGAWSLHKEDFMSSISFINELKPRITYGEAGNPIDIESISPYQTSQYYGSGSYAGGTTLVPTVPGNDNYKWEVAKELNVGVDFAVWNNRVSGSLSYYNRKTSDLYITYSLSGTTGFFSIDNFNGGEMQNRGYEVNLNLNVIRTKDTSLSLFGNFTQVKNKILSLGGVNEFEQGTSIIRVGLPYGSHYIVGWAGVDSSNGQPLYYDVNGNVTNVYSDANATANWGSFKPEIFGGFGAEFKYKSFTATANFRYKAKYYRFNNESYFMENPNFAQYNQSTAMNNMWTTPGQVTDIQSYLYPRQFSSKDIEDASFLRLQEVRLNYHIAGNFLGFMNGIDIFAIGNNLYTWTKWTGLDPDDSNNIGSYEYPFSRTITFGCKLNF
ncbi:SusC/RagA family TonB-linked outer membrane protein [Chryseobacterium profundimaris]|uniref:TonB-linked outer membrane protein, SusC/RagA family n=1 Tax=Chryseobacterium profundimaris TaxID=1387275 RepID=A0ABY1NED0_9FLAO|nr:SusC/RagA family TonB-linked outer membrane protein [Chryseobacterium profundimaris]SMP07588.1 TonB-linked outer membrane protein, SusC/RagA family [Chryseobacterium profundimaris]